MTSKTLSDLVPLSQALPELGVTRSKGYDLVLSGRLRGELVGGRWFVDPVSVADELARRAGTLVS